MQLKEEVEAASPSLLLLWLWLAFILGYQIIA